MFNNAGKMNGTGKKRIYSNQEIAKCYNMGDCLGFEALQTIAEKEDKRQLQQLIEDSWKVSDGSIEDEEEYHKRKIRMFEKYGFQFEKGECVGHGEVIFDKDSINR